MLVVRGKSIEEVLASFDTKGVGILREVAVLEHVVNVVPDRLEGNAEFAVVVHYIFGLAPVFVSLSFESVNVQYCVLVDLVGRIHEHGNESSRYLPSGTGGSRKSSRIA